jgi:ribosome maturation factor RimP
MADNSITLARLTQLADETSRREKCILYDVELVTGHRGQGRKVRIFIDRENSSESASIEDCANVSRGLSLLLDVQDVIEGGRYELEVSTPGLDRKLRLPWHFQRAKGKTIQVKSKTSFQPLDPSLPPRGAPAALKGRLLEATDLEIVVESDGRRFRGVIADLEKARVVFQPEPTDKRHQRKGT